MAPGIDWRLSGVIPFDVTAHFASSSGAICGAFQEFHVRRRPSTGELRVATPGVWTKDRRLVREEHDPLADDVRRLRTGPFTTGIEESAELSKASSSSCQQWYDYRACRSVLSGGSIHPKTTEIGHDV